MTRTITLRREGADPTAPGMEFFTHVHDTLRTCLSIPTEAWKAIGCPPYLDVQVEGHGGDTHDALYEGTSAAPIGYLERPAERRRGLADAAIDPLALTGLGIGARL